MLDIREVKDINKLVNNKNYNIQPSVYPKDVDLSLLD